MDNQEWREHHKKAYERAKKAYDLRNQGLTWRKVGELVGREDGKPGGVKGPRAEQLFFKYQRFLRAVQGLSSTAIRLSGWLMNQRSVALIQRESKMIDMCDEHGYCTLQSDCTKYTECGCALGGHCMYCLLPPPPPAGSPERDVCPYCHKSLIGAPVVKV